MDIQTDGQVATSFNAPYHRSGHRKKAQLLTCVHTWRPIWLWWVRDHGCICHVHRATMHGCRVDTRPAGGASVRCHGDCFSDDKRHTSAVRRAICAPSTAPESAWHRDKWRMQPTREPIHFTAWHYASVVYTIVYAIHSMGTSSQTTNIWQQPWTWQSAFNIDTLSINLALGTAQWLIWHEVVSHSPSSWANTL